MGVYIHDGGYVERLEGETYFPLEILEECSKHIEQDFDIPMVLTQKPIEYDWTPLTTSETQYEVRKREFEKRNFFIKDIFVHINEDNTIEYLKPSTMELQLKCNNWMEYNADLDKNVKKYFFKEWLEDIDRAKYEKIDFIPDESKCPSYVYNLFKGFKAASITPSKPFTDEEIQEMVEPILKHIGFITDGNPDFVLKWFANIIQNPTKKTEIALLLRDMGGLLTEGGGTGKSSMIDYFGTEILGDDFYYVINDNRESYGNFNGQFQGKLLIVVDEASGKENHSNHVILKAKITSKKQNVNAKNINPYSVIDYSNYIFFSNNPNPIPIKQGNRRFSAFDTNPCMRGNVKYFKDLYEHLNKDDVKWAFYQYLKFQVKTYESPIDFQIHIPITSAYKDIRRFNAPLYLKWLVYELKRGCLLGGSVGSMYQQFTKWVRDKKEGSEEGLLSETKFGLLLNNAKEIEPDFDLSGLDIGDKRKCNTGMKFKWNIEALVSGLVKLHLLDDGFVYYPYTSNDEE
jgi:hypothetical protein